MKTTLTIKGTHCPSCKMLIEDVCSEISGVNSCEVNVDTGITEVDHDESLDWSKLKNAIEALGEYKVEVRL